jgi:pimeloyl-ACP methyl ester carboxylesterase
MAKIISALLGMMLLLPVPAGAETTVGCRQVSLPVELESGLGADQTMVAELCGPEPLEGRVIHVLVSGATYGPEAWDFPYQPERYSYVRAMNQAGIATFNVHRLGIGQSSHPESHEVTTQRHIYIYHQLIQGLQDGVFGAKFGTIVLVGHSYGAVIAYGVANRYPEELAGVVITGLQHETDPAFWREFWGNLHPAKEEGGRFAELDEGYLTSRPGQRHTFYRPQGADAKVIERDEATKETFTVGDAHSFPPVMEESRGITDPVLNVMGQYDTWFCAGQPCSEPTGTPSRERHWFPETACFEQYVIPDTGHAVNLHFNSRLWFERAIEWTDRVVVNKGQCRV